jgi:hypothetical protein
VTEERAGVRGTSYEGLFFTEKPLIGASVTKHIRVKLTGQNRSLNDVKKAMAKQAHRVGANAVMNFRYGQKRGFFSWDDMSWFGEGDAVSWLGSEESDARS